MNNKMTLRFSALSQNESFARVVAGAFATQLNPTINELADIKTAVSEAVTNCVIHAYGGKGGEIVLHAEISGQTITLTITDFGKGIEDIDQAREPFYTTSSADERSGMGFTVMETFMDELLVSSEINVGTTVTMRKSFVNEVEQ